MVYSFFWSKNRHYGEIDENWYFLRIIPKLIKCRSLVRTQTYVCNTHVNILVLKMKYIEAPRNCYSFQTKGIVFRMNSLEFSCIIHLIQSLILQFISVKLLCSMLLSYLCTFQVRIINITFVLTQFTVLFETTILEMD